MGRFRSGAARSAGGAPSLADALGVVEADAAVLGRGGMTPLGKVVREAAAVAAVARAPGEIEAYVGQLRVQADELFEALAAAMSAACSFLAFSLAFAPSSLPTLCETRAGTAGGERVSARSRRNAGGAGEGGGGKKKQRPAPAPVYLDPSQTQIRPRTGS